MSRLHKVVAYVTRGRAGEAGLLVFDHPAAGVQLPAGTVEEAEDPRLAVLREVAEETGVVDCHIVTKLAEVEERPLGGRVILAAACQGFADPEAKEPVSQIRRGLYARRLEVAGSFTRLAIEDTRGPRVVWVESACVAETFQRHHFHVEARWSGPQEWTQHADGHLFRPRWVPLAPDVGLVEGQAEWLAEHHPALLRSLEGLLSTDAPEWY